MVLTSFGSFVAIYLPIPELVLESLKWFGKLAVSSVWTVIYTHTPEMFPTALRGRCLGIPDGFSRLTAVVTPFLGIVYQQSPFFYWIAHLVLVGLSIFCCLFLPETSEIYPDDKSDCRDQKSILL